MSRSPAVRLSVIVPGGPARAGVAAWLYSNDRSAEPVFTARVHARYRKTCCCPLTWAAAADVPKVVRSFLLGGIDPSTIVGVVLSSFVPWPKALSLLPEGTSPFQLIVAEQTVPVPVPDGNTLVPGVQSATPSSPSYGLPVNVVVALPTVTVTKVKITAMTRPCQSLDISNASFSF